VNDEDIASLSQGLHELATPRQLFMNKGHDDDKTLDDTSVIDGAIDGAMNGDGSNTSSNGFDSLESELPKQNMDHDLALENSLLKMSKPAKTYYGSQCTQGRKCISYAAKIYHHYT
jgi:hypothetical protein